MRKLLLALALGATAAAAQPGSSQPGRVTVALTSIDFTPATVRLRAGVPVTLRLEYRSTGGHNFAAPQFFAAARVAPASAAHVRRGAVEVRRRSAVEVTLVPAAGRYRLRCTHMLHTAFGMTGEILVE